MHETEQRPAGARSTFSYNVVAVLPDMETARSAIEALGHAGYEGREITIADTAPATPPETDHPADNAAADSRVMKRWFGLVTAWAVAGFIAGFPLGVGAGWLILEAGWISADVSLANLLLSGLLGALGVSTTTGLLGMVYPMQAGDAWESTFRDSVGLTLVGVHAADRKSKDRARQLLESHGALQVRETSGREVLEESLRAGSKHP